MKTLDRLSASALALVALAISFWIPRTYPGRMWIFGTDLALLFAAMLNLLRIRNPSTPGVRIFCLAANIAMFAFSIALMVSIGVSRTLANVEIPIVAGLLMLETSFSLVKTE